MPGGAYASRRWTTVVLSAVARVGIRPACRFGGLGRGRDGCSRRTGKRDSSVVSRAEPETVRATEWQLDECVVSEHDELFRRRWIPRSVDGGGALEWDELVGGDQPQSVWLRGPERCVVSEPDELFRGRLLPDQLGQQDVGGGLGWDELVDRGEP